MYKKRKGEYETYQATPSKNGNGTFYFADCGNRMYSVKGYEGYHSCICPKCGRTLYMRGTEEANKLIEDGYTGWLKKGV